MVIVLPVGPLSDLQRLAALRQHSLVHKAPTFEVWGEWSSNKIPHVNLKCIGRRSDNYLNMYIFEAEFRDQFRLIVRSVVFA